MYNKLKHNWKNHSQVTTRVTTVPPLVSAAPHLKTSNVFDNVHISHSFLLHERSLAQGLWHAQEYRRQLKHSDSPPLLAYYYTEEHFRRNSLLVVIRRKLSPLSVQPFKVEVGPVTVISRQEHFLNDDIMKKSLSSESKNIYAAPALYKNLRLEWSSFFNTNNWISLCP